MSRIINDPRIITALPDSKDILRSKFGDQEFTIKDSITILNRESTVKGSPVTSSFNLNFDHITQAVLKVNLLADEGRILSFIPNEFKLTEIIVNGKIFTPSDARQSVNIIDKVNDTSLNKILNPNGENQISVNFNAPIGAGVTSPHAEITAILILNGKRSQFALPSDINVVQIQKDVQGFIKDNFILTLVLIIGFIIILALIAFVSVNIFKTTGNVKGITGDIKDIERDVTKELK